MYKELINKKKKIAVVGLGYVGLPLAIALSKKFSVIGYDISNRRVNMMRLGSDPSGELKCNDFKGCDIFFTANEEILKEASFYIIAVPTPINQSNKPDLKCLADASETVGKCLKKGDIVVYESTVYPGCTEEDCVPLLELYSNLKAGDSFLYGYSPERINPGDKQHTLTNTIKIVSGCNNKALREISLIYREIITAGIYQAPSIKVAEAAKILENTQRDVNIALMNELSIICSRIGINTFDVLDAAGTKWNFLKFSPGLVGGHCIGVDPYYLVHKAQQLKYHPQVINAGRFINDSMGGYIGKKIVKTLVKEGGSLSMVKVLFMGITFKEDVSDIRNSKVVDIIREVQEYGVEVTVTDPHALKTEVLREYGIKMTDYPSDKYDAIVIAVAHKQYLHLDNGYFTSLSAGRPIIFDIKGIYRNKLDDVIYWSL